MRNGRKPTRKQKIRLGQAGLAPENWLVVRQKPDGELIILHKRTNMIRVVPSLTHTTGRSSSMSEKRERICPVCGRSYTDPPALSRRDNKTDICPECGMREALAAIPRRETPAERTRRAVYATGNKWAIENFEATHS